MAYKSDTYTRLSNAWYSRRPRIFQCRRLKPDCAALRRTQGGPSPAGIRTHLSKSARGINHRVSPLSSFSQLNDSFTTKGAFSMSGPLTGIKIVEFEGLGPAPFCGMMLADHGAEVVRIDRPTSQPDTMRMTDAVLSRTRRRVTLDLKNAEGAAAARDLCKAADGIIEGFRPGVMERLGLGPDVLLADNPKLVYGRITGWGQTGPLAHAAGHDINYIALSGVLHTIGGEKPVPPVNYLGDFGGGGMMLAFGIVSALLSVKAGGVGQVIDCAMTEGSALLASMVWQLHGSSEWHDASGTNILDGAAHFYNTYKCSDGKYLAIGSIEPQFYALLRKTLELAADPTFDDQKNSKKWTELKTRLQNLFITKTRAEWCALLEGTDACVAPVLSLSEAPTHPHNRARKAFLELGGATQPSPAPRYSATTLDVPRQAALRGADTETVLREIGYSPERIAALTANPSSPRAFGTGLE